jgi:hypoxanthine phosphoribosyltransferase
MLSRSVPPPRSPGRRKPDLDGIPHPMLPKFPELDAARDLERVLISQQVLAERILILGERIARDYADRKLVLVSVLKGGMVFLADLMRCVNCDHEIELIGASSYKGSTNPNGGVRITKDVDQNLAGKHVLLVEDIFDTGRTMRVAWELLKLHGPASLEICCLLVKPHAKEESALRVKYVGFEIENVFVVGYGLDYNQRYRNLPCIGVLKKELIQ